jgi:alkylation response protein AidB-like acyl-CoA dehydrogenase
MDTTLTEEEVMVRETARKFLESQCPPRLVREMEKDPLGYPPDLWRQAAELGWPGMVLPEQYGGSGLPLAYLGLVMQEVGRALAPLPLHSTVVAAQILANSGSDALCQEVLPGVASGDTIVTWAFTEQDPRHRPESVLMEAKADGDSFVLSGTKLFVDNFEAADYVVVVCRTAPASANNAGLTLFLVNTKAPGITNTPLVTLAKDRQSEVAFNNVRVPRGAMVGEQNQGAPLADDLIDLATVLLCAQMLGATRKDFEMGVEWSKYRKAFGQPIGAFQSLQHMCADMLMWIDGGELLTYEALWKMDQGLPAKVEVSQAKAFCNEKCIAAARMCQSIHGGIGFMMEFDLQLWYRRIAAWTTRLGTAYEHRARIAQALLDKPGKVILGRPVPVVEEA